MIQWRLMISILIVEDHGTVADMIARFVERYIKTARTEIVGSAEAALDYLAGIDPGTGESAHPDLALIDVSLPGMSGIDLVSKLQADFPAIQCLMLSGHKEPAYVRRSLEMGARGYVAKGNPPAIVEGVKQVLEGKVYVSEDVAG